MIKKGDFVKIEYTGSVDGVVFDTTNEKIAKDNGISTENKRFSPVIVCVGEKQIVSGIDKNLEGKDIGEFTAKISPEEGFGKKSPSLLKLIPMKQLLKHKIKPVIGLQLNIDGHYGIVKSVGGGRVIVDFNHPLSGKELEYSVKILEIVKDKKEQTKSILTFLRVPYKGIEYKDGHIIIKMHSIPPKEVMDILNEKIKRLVDVKTVSFEAGEKKEKV